jgi:predicted ATP-grasp superfamily ATP-dependent carboligase
VDIYVLSKYRDEFAAHIATPWPRFDVVRRVQDWLRLRNVAAAADVATPRTGLLDEWDRWDRPVVIKPRYSLVVEANEVRLPGMHFVESGSRPNVDAIVDDMGHVPIVQEYVPGAAEHGFFALYDEGVSKATFQHRRIRSFKYWGGASVYRRSVAVPELRDDGMRILEELEWNGPAMVEFKLDIRDGKMKLIEVNPRFWGSLSLAVHAGVNFPHLFYELATKGTVPSHTGYANGVASHLLKGEASYLHSVLTEKHDIVDAPWFPGAFVNVVRSLLFHPEFDFYDTDDVTPFLSEITSQIPDGEFFDRKAVEAVRRVRGCIGV